MKELYKFEKFIEFVNNAGFEIRDEDWRYTQQGMLLTFPNRDHASQFRDVMNGRDVEGVSVSIVRAITQKKGPDTKIAGNAVPAEAAILAALRNTYPLPAPHLMAAVLQPTAEQTTSAASPPPQGSDQRRLKKGDGKAEREGEEEGEGAKAKGGGKDAEKPPKGSPEPLDRMDTH